MRRANIEEGYSDLSGFCLSDWAVVCELHKVASPLHEPRSDCRHTFSHPASSDFSCSKIQDEDRPHRRHRLRRCRSPPAMSCQPCHQFHRIAFAAALGLGLRSEAESRGLEGFHCLRWGSDEGAGRSGGVHMVGFGFVQY